MGSMSESGAFWPTPPVFGRARIEAALHEIGTDAVVDAVRGALVAHARGETLAPAPSALVFTHPPGDCHIKAGSLFGADMFVVKVATGFYHNSADGLPVNNGVVLVFDARTGATFALLLDEGLLTSWRTAAAGALAAVAGAPARLHRLGIVGTGHQAAMQARWCSRALGVNSVDVWGRDHAKAVTLASELNVAGIAARAVTIEDLLADCRVVVTCTPASAPVVPITLVRPGTHIVALGADGPGKQELAPALLARAARIATDDHEQCLHGGEFGNAVRAGTVTADSDISLGLVLSGEQTLRRHADEITIADLTGVAAQDAALASLVLTRLLA